ncbi:MAG: hypothetical protein JWM35_2261 [Verrucomicrobia bacterium]|nr:hypothetical protein [Verrucomicrobiota bacterium]
MSKKVDRALYGPSWTEVIFGAVLSVVLGVVLAGAYLVFKPVSVVKELPKEPGANTVYYIEGSHDGTKARRMAAKQKIFLQGGSIAVVEDEINLALIPANTAAPAKGAPAPAKAAPEPTNEIVAAGTPNFRIHDGLLQMSVPVQVKYSLVGLDASFLVQTQGTFVRDGDVFVYEPTVVYVGSCPVQRVPMLKGLVTKKFLNAQRFPPDIVAAWNKLAEVSIDGSTLKLSMPGKS